MKNMIPNKCEIDKALEDRHSVEIQNKLRESHVAVCGLGGLGSNIAISLARCGVEYLHIIDFDYVDLSNINRQQYVIKQIGMKKTDALKKILLDINPYICVKTDFVKINDENCSQLLENDEYICEAFDVPEEKAMITNCILEKLPEKYLVGASGMAGYGKSNDIISRKITEKYFLCGDGISEINKNTCLMAPRVMICAAHQANMILDLIIKNK